MQSGKGSPHSLSLSLSLRGQRRKADPRPPLARVIAPAVHGFCDYFRWGGFPPRARLYNGCAIRCTLTVKKEHAEV